jgi:aspartyl/asparaginyl-tRNA synthetase
VAIAVDADLLHVAQRANILAGVRAFLVAQGYVEVDVPQMVVSTGACEALDMFSVDNFGDLAFMRQTGQLYLEEFVVRGLPRVYCEGQSFRKEPSSGDGRHLCEFRLIEIEKKDMSLDELFDVSVATLRHVVDNLSVDLFDDRTLQHLHTEIDGEIPCITYREALTILDRLGQHMEFGDDIERAGEQLLIDELGTGALAIIEHPTPLKFFNMRQNRSDPTVVDSLDLILKRAGETFGAALRETDPDNMRQRLHDQPMYGYLLNRATSFARECANAYGYPPGKTRDEARRMAERIDQSFEDYFSMFVDNPVERGGYGLGVARLFQYILDTESIDQAVTYPVTRSTFH